MTSETRWSGARWQLSFVPPGASWSSASAVDATTTPQGHAWALDVRDHLVHAGLSVGLGRDEGEDGAGNPTWYEQLTVRVEGASMDLSFWVDTVFWSVDTYDEECREETFTAAARLVVSVLTEVTGYVLQEHVHPTDRTLLGLPKTST